MGNWFSSASVRKKILLSVGGLFIVAFLVLGVVLNGILRSNALESYEQEANLQAAQVDNGMDLFLSGLRDGLVNMAEDPLLKQGGDITKYMNGDADASGMIAMDPVAKGGFEAQAYALFERFGQANKSTVSVISYGTTDGGYLQYPAIKRKKGYDSRKRDWFTESMKDTSAVRITKPFKTSKGTPTVGIFATVKGADGTPRGVLGLNIDLPVITDMIGEIKVGETGYIMLLDSDGVIIADPKHPDKAFTKLSDAELGDLSQETLTPDQPQTMDIDGGEKLVSTYRSDKTGYQYVTVIDRSEALASVTHMRWILAIVLLVMLAIVFLATLRIATLITAPLRSLQGAAGQLAGGDLRDIHLEAQSDDEIGDLTHSFSQMTENLRDVLQHLKHSSDNVSEASGQMSQGVEQVAQTITHAAEQVSGISDAAGKQSESLGIVVGNMREMTDQVAGIADASKTISDVSGKAGSAASDGASGIESAVSQMETIRATVQEAVEAVSQLEKGSAHIGEVIGTIQGIAEQTNLLALNAAIEAARAGEAGRGFSVVADEVRKLAEQSQQAAEEIAATLGKLQDGTTHAVETMHAGAAAVESGHDAVQTAGEKFREIVDHIAQVDRLVKDAATQADSVAGATMRVLKEAEDAEGVTKQVSDNISSISAAIEEQSASMEEISASSQDLSHMAEDMQKQAGKFRF